MAPELFPLVDSLSQPGAHEKQHEEDAAWALVKCWRSCCNAQRNKMSDMSACSAEALNTIESVPSNYTPLVCDDESNDNDYDDNDKDSDAEANAAERRNEAGAKREGGKRDRAGAARTAGKAGKAGKR